MRNCKGENQLTMGQTIGVTHSFGNETRKDQHRGRWGEPMATENPGYRAAPPRKGGSRPTVSNAQQNVWVLRSGENNQMQS